MKVYSLTRLGASVAVKTSSETDEARLLRYMYARRSSPVTEDDLTNFDNDARFMVHRLQRQHLVEELTA